MSEYTPTTDEVRTAHRYLARDANEDWRWAEQDVRSDAEFDRWLNEERAKVFFEGVQHQWTHRPIGNRSPHNPYRKG